MTKTVAILQSNYIPWKGYFDLIRAVDEFIILDEVQYTRRDWRNRNLIKTPGGLHWLTIPVHVKGKYHQLISETETQTDDWGEKHWRNIKQNYSKTIYFETYAPALADFYLDELPARLSEVNLKFINLINQFLAIQTPIAMSSDYHLAEGKTDRLLSLCQQAGADVYLSGPAAQSYLDTDAFERAKIQVKWANYSNYPEYPQLHPPFEHGVSVLDLLFNTGPDALKYMKNLL